MRLQIFTPEKYPNQVLIIFGWLVILIDPFIKNDENYRKCL